MTTGKQRSGESIASVSAMPGSGPSEFATSVLRWQAGPAPISEMALGSIPQVLAVLCGDLGCRVLFGPTEDLTGAVLRVYHEDHSLAMFPRSEAEMSDVLKWAMGPTVLQDIERYGEETEQREGRRKRRSSR